MANDLTCAHQTYLADRSDPSRDDLLTAVRIFAVRRAHRSSGIDAEDIGQRTMVAVWQGLERFTGKATIETWVSSIVRNKIKDALRERYAEPKLEALQFWEMDELTVHDDYVPDITISQLDTCSTEDKLLLQLLAEDATSVAIAQHLGISTSALRQRKTRLRKKLSEVCHV